jgi:DNA (cytosine-5)-methyltransferase 1
MNPIPVVAIDFFCGAGGMTNGLIQAGIHVLGGVDNQPLCEQTYVQNKNPDGTHPAYICKDIFPKARSYPNGQQHEIRDAIEGAIRNFKRLHGIRKVKLVFAICAPCQPFTKITKIEMSEGRQFKRKNDANLLTTTLALIKEFRPAAIICENVEGMIGKTEDSVLGGFKRTLKRNGYSFQAKVINASKFGVPQNRRRTIGIGIDTRVYSVGIDVPEMDESRDGIVTVAEAIGHLPALAAGDVDPFDPNHRARALSPLNLKRIASAPPGGSNAYLSNTPYGDLTLDCHNRVEEKWGTRSFSDVYTRLSGTGLAPTITTKCVSISNGRFAHYDPRQNRGLTPREAALLQTFPEEYIFYPEDNIQFSAIVIGNAVPPRLAAYFGSAIVRAIE